jgi:8-oxo-dGTP pyrophosphatase MutT (NUDIX family)
MYSIYYLDNVLIINENKEKYPGNKLVFAKDKKALCSFAQNWIDNENRLDTVIYGYDTEKMFRHLKKCFKYVEAAGGVVRNSENKLLFIRRWNIWDLPKGKVNKKEDIETCALRETEEETGVSGLQITGSFPSSFHFYFYKEKLFLKKTYWFLMDTQYTGVLKPQLEEDITEVKWLNSVQCRNAFHETYRSLRDNLEVAVCNIPGR